jgi:hypothetical protein
MCAKQRRSLRPCILPIMKPLLPLLVVSLLPAMVAATHSMQGQVDAVLAEMRLLRPMEPRMRYTLPARGVDVSGSNDDFLRRRTASEIIASGLSCGCGDYAVVFIERIEALGYETLLVDSAQISALSLASNFAGHAVVAIRPNDAPDSSWWLVDSTARKILSRDWSPQAKTFTASGGVYWIGYCGPLDRYPVRAPAELKQFYADTLAKVPREFFNRTLHRFVFKVDRSLLDDRGGYLNPNVTRLQREQERIFAKYAIEPEREVAILLARGDNDARSDLNSSADGWVSRVGLKSACSPGLLSYFEQRIRHHEDRAAQ